jgi:hypothetical protein
MRNMHKETYVAHVRFSLFGTLKISAAGIAFILFLGSPAELALGQNPAAGSQETPSEIPEFQVDDDPTGQIATYQPGGATVTADNAFFQNLGTNGRTCFTCHQPQNGWTISAASVQARFAASAGTEPLFRLVDGAACPTNNISSLQQRQQAYQLLTGKGLIRIGISLPPNQFTQNLQFEVSNVDDPYN